MSDYAQPVQDATDITPRMECALGQKYWHVPPEEISIAVDGAFLSYCNAARSGTIGNEEPWGYIWSASERLLQKYLLHNKREAPMGEERYEYDAMDHAAHDFNISETLHIILPLLSNSYREILELHKLEELSFEEIAVMKSKPIGTIRQQYHRALLAAREIAARDGLCPPPT
ncbi:MAG TPA: sigma factor-like helix-turn-helix DNA-binding protein [Candidatus Kapabacteria bacterium]|nr:sigma factor-like helix-turn-helix DNA-binding protein [Candidatus Kapabacteria bacterium]